MRQKLGSFSSSSPTLISREAQCSQLQSAQVESVICPREMLTRLMIVCPGMPVLWYRCHTQTGFTLPFMMSRSRVDAMMSRPWPYTFDETRLCPSSPTQRMLGRIFPVVLTVVVKICPPFLVKMIINSVFNLSEYRGLKKKSWLNLEIDIHIKKEIGIHLEPKNI